MGSARHGASSLLSPEGFFLGKMGFREAVAAGDVALPQVRKCGCREDTPLPRLRPEGTVTPSGAGAGAGCFPGSNTGAITRKHRDGSSSVAAPGCSRCPLSSPFRCGKSWRPSWAASGSYWAGTPLTWTGTSTCMCSQVHGLVVPGSGAVCPGGLGDAPRWGDVHLTDSAPPAGVCQVFAEVLQDHGVRFTRLPLERGVGGCTWLEAPARAFACSVERDARAAVGPFSGRGLRYPPTHTAQCPFPLPGPGPSGCSWVFAWPAEPCFSTSKGVRFRPAAPLIPDPSSLRA